MIHIGSERRIITTDLLDIIISIMTNYIYACNFDKWANALKNTNYKIQTDNLNKLISIKEMKPL